MYIHLGNGTVVRSGDVIGVFDIEITSVEKFTREYLAAAGKRHSEVYVSYDMPRSFILAEEKGKERIYISPISSGTIMERAEKQQKL